MKGYKFKCKEYYICEEIPRKREKKITGHVKRIKLFVLICKNNKEKICFINKINIQAYSVEVYNYMVVNLS